MVKLTTAPLVKDDLLQQFWVCFAVLAILKESAGLVIPDNSVYESARLLWLFVSGQKVQVKMLTLYITQCSLFTVQHLIRIRERSTS